MVSGVVVDVRDRGVEADPAEQLPQIRRWLSTDAAQLIGEQQVLQSRSKRLTSSTSASPTLVRLLSATCSPQRRASSSRPCSTRGWFQVSEGAGNLASQRALSASTVVLGRAPPIDVPAWPISSSTCSRAEPARRGSSRRIASAACLMRSRSRLRPKPTAPQRSSGPSSSRSKSLGSPRPPWRAITRRPQ